jgi:hypothetical protein
MYEGVTAPHTGLKKTIMVYALRLEKTKLRRKEEELRAESSYIQEACEATPSQKDQPKRQNTH